MSVQHDEVNCRTVGATAAFGGWYRRSRPAVERYCQRMLGDVAAASDVTQEVFARAWLTAERFGTEEHLRRWAYIVARNLCIDTIRARTRVVPTERIDERPQADAPPDDALMEQLDRALTRVTARNRTLLQLRYWDGLDNDDVAARMGLSGPTTRVALHRARSELRRELLSGVATERRAGVGCAGR